MAEPVPELSERGAATRRRLLDAACRELLECDGRLEVAALARRLRKSPALLYRYFGSKDGLAAAVVEEFYDQYDEAVFLRGSSADGFDWQAREQARIAREVSFLYRNPLSKVVLGRVLREPAASYVDAQRVVRQIEIATQNVVRGQGEGAVDPAVEPGLAAAAYIGAFREAIGEALRRPEPPPQESVVEILIAIGAAIVPAPSNGRSDEPVRETGAMPISDR